MWDMYTAHEGSMLVHINNNIFTMRIHLIILNFGSLKPLLLYATHDLPQAYIVLSHKPFLTYALLENFSQTKRLIK